VTGIDVHGVFAVAYEARPFLENRWDALRRLYGWPQLPGQAASDGMCLFSACFLKFVLRQEFPDAGWRCVGGSSDKPEAIDPSIGMPGGCRDAEGRWHGHHWVEDALGELAVDVTLDQFGGPPVWAADPRRQVDGAHMVVRRNWFSREEDAAVDCIADEVYGWMTDWHVALTPSVGPLCGPLPSRVVRGGLAD